MTTWNVYGSYVGTVSEEVEAETSEDALQAFAASPSLCHHCARVIELNTEAFLNDSAVNSGRG